MSLQNSYTLRTATQDRPCFICNKFTTLVLTVEDGVSDWFYVCKSHIADTNFCHVGTPPSPSPEVVKKKVEKKKNDKEEQPAESNSVTELMSSVASGLWNTIAGKKEEKQEKKENEKEEKKDEKEENKKNGKLKDIPGSFTGLSPVLPTNATIAKPKYILNRDIFFLREIEFKKKLKKKEAAERLMKLEFPAVPKTAPV